MQLRTYPLDDIPRERSLMKMADGHETPNHELNLDASCQKYIKLLDERL